MACPACHRRVARLSSSQKNNQVIPGVVRGVGNPSFLVPKEIYATHSPDRPFLSSDHGHKLLFFSHIGTPNVLRLTHETLPLTSLFVCY